MVKLGVRPARAAVGVTPYQVPKPAEAIDLYLDGNEGVAPRAELLETVRALGAEALRRYPSKVALEAQLAERFGVAPRQVIVTAGGDDALERACKATLESGRTLILPSPSFEMLERYAHTSGAAVEEIDWREGAFPTAAVCAAVTERTGAIAVVSPNNPTGAAATADDVRRVSAAAQQALVIVDLAYGEFADEDLTPVALTLPNAIVVRSCSKAWGLAGLRVGYAIGPAAIIDWLRAVGNPYPTSSLSLALAARRLREGTADMERFVARVRRERAELAALLGRLGARAQPSQANFVLARVRDAEGLCAGLAERGIAVRRWPETERLADAVRITCPGATDAFERLSAALTAVHVERPDVF